MLFSQVASFTLFFLGIGSAIASPTPDSAIVARQDENEVSTILQNLQNSLSGPLGQITDHVNGGTASETTITPLINQISSSISGATNSLQSLPPRRRHLKRGVITDVAVLLATIIKDVSIVLHTLLGIRTILVLDTLLVSIDVVLQGLLTSVNILLIGVEVTVEGLLVDVTGILEDLGFSLVLGLLGILL